MKLKKLATVIAISAAFGAGAIGQAHADAMAEAEILISNFFLTKGGGVPLDLTDFTQLTVLDTLNNSANLTPPGISDSHFASSAAFAAAVDALQACVGVCTKPQNAFAPDLPPPITTFSRADSLLTGQPITGTGFPAGASSQDIAETSIGHTNAFGGADADILLTSTFTFALAHPIAGADIEFDASTFLLAWTALGSLPGSSAGAGFKGEFTLTDGLTGATLVDWIPNGNIATGTQTGLTVLSEPCTLVANASATFSQPTPPTLCGTAALPLHFAAVTNFVLDANHPYSITLDQHTTSQAAERVVPEPASIALLGIGLAGMGFARRRRRV